MEQYPVVVVGAGPAGLTAAHILAKRGIQSLVLEQSDKVGGIARTEVYKGYRFDIGGHRYYTKVEQVHQLWHEVMGEDFIKVPRLSRIYYDGRFFNYPLEPVNALRNLGIGYSFLVLWSYLRSKLFPLPEENTFEQWVINRFGRRLYQTFFKTYTEKVWGISCDKIQADWAAQRIKNLSLKKAVLNALFSVNDTKTLIKEFDYPILGPGMMWEKFQAQLDEWGSPVRLNTPVVQIKRSGYRVTEVVSRQEDGSIAALSADHVISSMPVSTLLTRLDPPPPDHVLAAARGLNYRDFLIVSIIVDQKDVFPDNWIYIHSPEFRVGRIQNFKNWSPAMVPDASKTCLGMEYFCSEGDDLWELTDVELIELASREVVNLGLLGKQVRVEDGVVIRQKKAYPVYDGEYRQHLSVIREYLSGFENLQTVGRNGMHRYNNSDHSMLTGILAAYNVLGENFDLWEVNTERSYYEEFTTERHQKAPELQVSTH